MSFSHLRLPASVIAELYKTSLIQLKEEADKNYIPAEDPRTRSLPNDLQYLGNNLKNILIIVFYPQEKFLPSAALDLLTNIFTACHLGIQDIALINSANTSASFDEILTLLHPNSALLFGTNTLIVQNMPDVPDLEVFEFSGVSMIKGPSLETFSQNNKEGKIFKSKLWVSLKQLFKVT